jgi:hypothetical protein
MCRTKRRCQQAVRWVVSNQQARWAVSIGHGVNKGQGRRCPQAVGWVVSIDSEVSGVAVRNGNRKCNGPHNRTPVSRSNFTRTHTRPRARANTHTRPRAHATKRAKFIEHHCHVTHRKHRGRRGLREAKNRRKIRLSANWVKYIINAD